MDEDGYQIYPSWTKRPVVIGHEFAGQVAAVGSQVTDFKVGDLVTAEQLHWCGKCSICRKGLFNHCRNMGRLGFVTNGAFAEYVAVKERYVWNINGFKDALGSEDAAYEAGAVIEPTGIAYNGLFTRSGGFLPGSTVVVYGAGPIGLACHRAGPAWLARARSLLSRSARRGRRWRASWAPMLSTTRKSWQSRAAARTQVVMDLTDGYGADMHVECTGVPKVILPEIEQSLAVNAKVVNLGRRAGTTPSTLSIYQDTGSQIVRQPGAHRLRDVWQHHQADIESPVEYPDDDHGALSSRARGRSHQEPGQPRRRQGHGSNVATTLGISQGQHQRGELWHGSNLATAQQKNNALASSAPLLA